MQGLPEWFCGRESPASVGALCSYWSGGDPTCLRAAKPPTTASETCTPRSHAREERGAPAPQAEEAVCGTEDPVQPETSK